jgi:thiol-disulfide isomerase/thioredoxin
VGREYLEGLRVPSPRLASRVVLLSERRPRWGADMRSILLRGLVFVAVLAQGCSAMKAKGVELIGRQAPEARLMYLDGSEIPLSAQRGKYTAIIFWATWCSHSKTAIVQYEELARRYAKRKDVEFLAVSVDKNEDFGTLKDRIKYQDLRTMTHIFSGNDSQDDAFVNLQGESIPYFVFIDKEGIVRLVDSEFDPLEMYVSQEMGK